jgi:hypothetical protein
MLVKRVPSTTISDCTTCGATIYTDMTFFTEEKGMALDERSPDRINHFMGGILNPALAAITPEVLDLAFTTLRSHGTPVEVMDQGPSHRTVLATLGGVECVQRFDIDHRGARSETTIIGSDLEQLAHYDDLAGAFDTLLSRSQWARRGPTWCGRGVLVELNGECSVTKPLKLKITYGSSLGSLEKY